MSEPLFALLLVVATLATLGPAARAALRAGGLR